ncbi:hypothetical protein C2G38_2058476 [Gigaspora rosea]|uniref:Uncharacterized protein n=1 Tax=Gigaspora rosea TaxID=44941 RepID=A0A397W404_9GLOM|nr:hypothetical protein C2G38_2058476 [Gigaspora rosea]
MNPKVLNLATRDLFPFLSHYMQIIVTFILVAVFCYRMIIISFLMTRFIVIGLYYAHQVMILSKRTCQLRMSWMNFPGVMLSKFNFELGMKV